MLSNDNFDKIELTNNLNSLDQELATLTASLAVNEEKKTELEDLVTQVKTYYLALFLQESNENKLLKIYSNYEEFVNNLKEVRNGSKSADEALLTIQQRSNHRKIAIFFYNIAKLCELFFWAAATVTCVNACITIGVPLILTQPLISLAIAVGTVILMMQTAKNTVACFSGFKSNSNVVEECNREKALVSFFKPFDSGSVEVEDMGNPNQKIYPNLNEITQTEEIGLNV